LRSISVASVLVLGLALSAAAQPFGRELNVITIDRVTLERYHIRTLADALRLAAGFDKVRTYFKQDVSTARSIFQEHYANDVLLMIDGTPTWFAATGEGNLKRIDVGEIERIEFIRGPASVRFGTNAYAGAINIVLRRPAGTEVEGRISGGTEGHFGAAARAAFSARGWSILIAGRADDEEGDTVRYTDERNATGLFSEFEDARNVTLAAGDGRHALLLNAMSASESFLGNVPEFAQGMGQDHQSRGWLGGYRYTRPIGARTNLSYRAGYDWNRRNWSRSTDGITRSNVEGWRLQHDLSAVFRATPSLRIDAGAAYNERRSVEYTIESIRTGALLADNNMRDRGVSERSLFAEVEWTRGALTVSGGSRLTKNELFGSNVSSTGGVELALTPASSLFAMVRQSYRAPSLFELYFQTAVNSVYGNTALRPETSTSWDLGYERTAGPLTGQVSVYRATYDDKILRVRRLPDDPVDRSLIYTNSGGFRASGVELDVRYELARRAHGLLAWTWTDSDSTRLRFAPPHRVTAGASFAAPRSIDVSTLVTYRSGVDGPLEPIGAQTTVDLNGSWTQSLGALAVRHEVSARNVGGRRITYPEYIRGVLNEIEDVHGRSLRYTAHFRWQEVR
jgi:outer membrane cobalamin receptor